MAVGDIKGPEAVVVELTAGATVAVGDVIVHETDDKFDPCVDNDRGKFAVAITAGADGEAIRAVIWGPVEVTATAAVIGMGELCMAGTTACVTAEDYVVPYGAVGTAMTAFGSGGTGTVWVGLGA